MVQSFIKNGQKACFDSEGYYVKQDALLVWVSVCLQKTCVFLEIMSLLGDVFQTLEF